MDKSELIGEEDDEWRAIKDGSPRARRIERWLAGPRMYVSINRLGDIAMNAAAVSFPMIEVETYKKVPMLVLDLETAEPISYQRSAFSGQQDRLPKAICSAERRQLIADALKFLRFPH